MSSQAFVPNITASESNRSPKRAFFLQEKFGALVIVLLFILINFAVATRTPVVYCDEPPYVDPAANLYFGKGFTSTMWAQDRNAFWAGNTPLYQFLLFADFKLFHFGLFQARIANTLLTGAAGLMLWLAVRRMRIIQEPLYRLTALALILSGSVSTLTFRTIRPDATMFFVCASIFAAASIRNPKLKFCALMLASSLGTAAGLALLPYLFLMLGILVLLSGFRFWGTVVAIGFGLAGGAVGLCCFYKHFSALSDFVEIVLPFTALGSSGGAPLHVKLLNWLATTSFKNTENPLESIFGYPFEFVSHCTLFDAGAALLFVTLVFFGVRHFRSLTAMPQKMFLFALLATLGIPPAIQFAAHYHSYYRWMTYIPLCILVPATVEACLRSGAKPLMKRIALVAFFICIGLGIPLRTVFILPKWSERSLRPLEQVADQIVKPSDVVICDWKAYFTVCPRASLVFVTPLPSRGVFEKIKDLPKNQVSLLCLDPKYYENVIKAVGGQWQPVGMDGLAGAAQLAKTRYALTFYRRIQPAIN